MPLYGPSSYRSEPRLLKPRQDAIDELSNVRHSEMLSISQRLGRIPTRSKASSFATAANTFASAGLGALLAGILLMQSKERVAAWVAILYWAAVGVTFILSAVCALAARSIDQQRTESISAIKEDFDAFLAAYQREDDEG